MPKSTPYDLESEQAVVGSMIWQPALIKQIDLSAEDFYDSRCRRIYQCIGELAEEGIEISLVSVNAKIKARGFDEDITKDHLLALDERIGTAIVEQWRSYVGIIKKKSAARAIIKLGQEMQKFGQNGLNDLGGKIETTMAQLIEIRAKANLRNRSVKEKVLDWVNATTGDFFATECIKDLGCATERDKQTIRRNLQRLENDNVIVKCGKKNGCFRLIEKDAPLIDFLNVNLSAPYPIRWPFKIEELVDLYPGNVVVVAGAANAGKTALLLNVVKMNQGKLPIEYFSSEMGPEEFHLRLRKFEDIKLKDWRFAARQRASNFADVIVPDALNIIDYLEVTKDFYEIGDKITAIWDRLNKGIAIIAVQKKKGAEYGRGGEFTMEKPRLYLSIDSGELKIVKGKNWANPEINPNGMSWKFKLVQGCTFIEMGGSAWDFA